MRRVGDKEEDVAELASSIVHNGLLHPIGVRPLGTGCFELIYGRRRLSAHRSLSVEQIAAKVYDCSDEDADRLRRAENIFRQELSEAQRALAMKRYLEDVARKLRDEGQTSDEPGAASSPVTRVPHGVLKEIAATSDQSMSTVERTSRIAMKLREDQLEALHEQGAGRVELDTIARLPDPSDRDDVVELVASGTKVREAVARVTGPADGKVKLADGRRVDTPLTAKELSDDEWLRLIPNRGRFKNTEAFDQAALSYRRCHDKVQALYDVVRQIAKVQRNKQGKTDPFIHKLNRALWISHPSDWLACGTCETTGKAENGTDCTTSHGEGFVVNTDYRLL